MDEEEKRKAIVEYSYLQARLEAFLKEREEVLQEIEEIEDTIDSIEECKKDIDSLFSIGGGVYCKGVMGEEKFLVNVGAGVFLELDKNGAREILERKREILEKAVERINKEIESIVSKQEKIAEKLRVDNV
jgi:prefoldin alpha subunit